MTVRLSIHAILEIRGAPRDGPRDWVPSRVGRRMGCVTRAVVDFDGKCANEHVRRKAKLFTPTEVIADERSSPASFCVRALCVKEPREIAAAAGRASVHVRAGAAAQFAIEERASDTNPRALPPPGLADGTANDCAQHPKPGAPGHRMIAFTEDRSPLAHMTCKPRRRIHPSARANRLNHQNAFRT